MRFWPFRDLVGRPNISHALRPNISHALRAVVRFAHAPKQNYWKAARGFLQCLNASRSYGIMFQRSTGLELVAVFRGCSLCSQGN